MCYGQLLQNGEFTSDFVCLCFCFDMLRKVWSYIFRTLSSSRPKQHGGYAGKQKKKKKSLPPPLYPSKGQYYHATELKREHYANVVTSLQRQYQKLVTALLITLRKVCQKCIRSQFNVYLFH